MAKEVLSSNHDQDWKRQRCYYQLGAPSLVYEGNRTEENLFNVPSTRLKVDNGKELHDAWRERNRVKARWQYSLDLDQGDSELVQDRGKRNRSSRDFDNWDDSAGDDDIDDNIYDDTINDDTDDEDDDGDDGDDRHYDQEHLFDRYGRCMIDRTQQRNRLSMLFEANSQPTQQMCMLQDHALYEYPYAPISLHSRKSTKSGIEEPRILQRIHSCTEEFGILNHLNSDPSSLAPFDLEGMTKTLSQDAGDAFRKKLLHGHPEKVLQGNALVAVPCPCVPCSNRTTNDRSWLLCHPKGPCLERFCVSNLVLPLGLDILGLHSKARKKSLKNLFHWKAVELLSNEVDLDDTILEVRKCGEWNAQILQCLFVVRTCTHISVVNVQCKRPELEERGHGSARASPTMHTSICWGCYVVTERERIDLRSLSRKSPSLRPVSITCHPRYGNSFVPAKFAFVAHSPSNDLERYNVLHTCTSGMHKVFMERHDIMNLRHVTHIDFTSSNPMCLWSAATSYIRPVLSPGVIAQITKMEKAPFGLGSSLYTIDLRSNEATFQWSPSAEEMVTEGVHSISGLLTDWDRENSVWVTSTSAGKTWEIDGRMPCRSINSWSLTSTCEATPVLTVPSNAFFSDHSILTRTVVARDNDRSNCASAFGGLPMVKVDTDVGRGGIHLFQRPQNRPRFQTENLECIAAHGIDFATNASIATSSYFAVPEVAEDVSICGVASIRFPLNKFVESDEGIWEKLLDRSDEVSVLCTLCMTNNGDVYSHSLLECPGGSIEESSRFEGLPVGASSISIPSALDGRAKHLDDGHWKPTGGMNIRLFLSNSYPMSRNAKLSSQRQCRGKKEVVLGAGKRIKADNGPGVVRIKRTTHQPGVRIYSEHETHEMVNARTQLTLPPLPLKDVGMTVFFRANEDNDSTNCKQTMREEESSNRRSDLSSSGIQRILDQWEVSTPSSDSEENA